MDYYQAQNKYRQKQLKTFLSTIIKLIIFSLAFLIGWWLGNSDKLVLIQENEKIIAQFNEKKDNLERQLIDIRLKLKEANLSLDTQNIKNLNSDFGSIDGEGNFTEGQKVKSVKYSVLYMKAIKTLQEAQTRIETLETKVKALEDA